MTQVMASADEVAWPVAVAVRNLIGGELAGAVGGPPATVAVVPGRDVAIDDCCAGLAWVRIVRVFPSDPGEFPNARTAAVTADGCLGGLYWAVELGVGSARCAPSEDDAGVPPTGAELEASAFALADDAGRIRRAVLCGLPGLEEVDEVAIGEQTNVGPSGGCVGQELLVTVLTRACVCGEE
ncbi:hypothetical protein Ait01nite_020290 [Actinoplanes italicus]|nr:hypothetical protein Ait01nite_020290 [Actinoplanes italicus]